jgi:hypothetical protein
MTDLRTKIVHLLINDHDQHISDASTADAIIAMPEIAASQARIAELEAALQSIASADDMHEPVAWAVYSARDALKENP